MSRGRVTAPQSAGTAEKSEHRGASITLQDVLKMARVFGVPLLAASCVTPTVGVAVSEVTKTATPPATPEPTMAPKPENPVEKGRNYMLSALNDYFSDLSETERKDTAKSLDGATMSTFMATRDGVAYTPERYHVGDHTLAMSAIRSKTGQPSFLFYDLTIAKDRVKLVDIKTTPGGDIVGIDRKTGKVVLTIDNAYQQDEDSPRLVLNPRATIQMKWNGDSRYQDLNVELDASGAPFQGELVTGQIAFKSQSSGDQIALENETSGGAGRGLLSVVNRNKADLPILDSKKDGLYVPSLKDKGLNPFIPAVEKSPALSGAIEAYVKAMNAGKGVNEPKLEPAKVQESLTIQQLTDVKGSPFFVAVSSNGVPFMIKTEGEEWTQATIKNIANALGFNLSVSLGGYGSAADYGKLVQFQTSNFSSGMVYFGSNNWIGKDTADISAPQSDKNIALNAGMENILGLNLLWANDVPSWIKNGNFSSDQMQNIITNYLKNTIGAMNGKINSWVVVNEFNHADNGVDAFKKAMGDGYVDYTFAQARKLDPKATLIYNDYANETINGERYSITKQIIDRLKAVDSNIGVGLQMHIQWNNVPDMNKVIEAMQSYGVPVYVTEFDVNMDGFQGTQAEKEKLQADIYNKMVAASVRSGVVKQFNVFGLIDRLSVWEAPGRFGGHQNADPLILRDDFSPKQSFWGIQVGLIAGAQPAK